MTLKRYTGLRPSNVSKDAKYSVTADGEIRLVYRATDRERWLLSTADHDELARMVDAVKMQVNFTRGGVFYINEFGDVLVPDPAGGKPYWAGHYSGVIEFTFEGKVISSIAPPGLNPGDAWPGPHAGIRYVLMAGGNDIKYLLEDERRTTEVRLSDERGASVAARIANRLAQVKGRSGGRIYINERSEFFGPVSSNDYSNFVYLGNLDEDLWFSPPAGYDRP